MRQSSFWWRACRVIGLILFAASAIPALAGDAMAADPLVALLEYAEAVRPHEQPIGTVRTIGPDSFLQHPYAEKSLSRRMMDILGNPEGGSFDLATVLLDEIRDAKRVESVLANPGEGVNRLRALAEIHPLTIFSREEFEVLGDIVREMARAGYSREQLARVIGLIGELEPMLHMDPNYPTISSRLVEVERACLLARRHKADPAQEKAILDLLAADPFDTEILYGAACLLALTGQPEAAKNLLARLSLLDSTVPHKVEQDPDLADLRQDKGWFDLLAAGKARPVLKPAPNPGISGLTMSSNPASPKAGGLSNRLPASSCTS